MQGVSGGVPVPITAASGIAIPVSVADAVTSGSISALNANLSSGTATTGSTVALSASQLNNKATAAIQVTGTFSATLIGQVSIDGVNWVTLNSISFVNANTGAYSAAITAPGVYTVDVAAMGFFRVTCSAYTSGLAVVTMQAGQAAQMVTVDNALPAGNNLIGGFNLQQVVGAALAPVSTTTYGCAIPIASISATANTDYNATMAAASGSSAAISSSCLGVSCAFDINVTAWAAGSSTGLDIFLQWSPDNGTTWYDLWQVEAVTATGHYYIPSIFIPGRRRVRWVNRTGAATTATVTVTAMQSGAAPSGGTIRQFFDRTATLLSGTLNAVSTAYDMTGCKVVSAKVTLGAATTPASYQLQVSDDGVNYAKVGSQVAAVANGTTLITSNGLAVGRFWQVVCTSAGSSQTGTVIALSGSN